MEEDEFGEGKQKIEEREKGVPQEERKEGERNRVW